MSFFRQALISSALTYAAIPLAYLIRLAYARGLSVASFGLFYAIIALLSLLSIVANLGMGAALGHLLPKHRESREGRRLATAAALVTLTGTIVVSAALYALAPYLQTHYFKADGAALALRILTGYFLAQQALQVLTNVFTGLQETWAYTGRELYRQSLVLGLSLLVAAVANLDLISTSIVWVVANGTMTIAYLVALRIRFPAMRPERPDRTAFNELFAYGLPTILVAGASVIMAQIDTVMITAMRTVHEVAAYNVAYPTAQLLLAVASPLFVILLPEISALYHAKRLDEARSLTATVSRIMLAVSVLGTIVVATLAKPALDILFGSNLASAWPALAVLAVGLAASGLANVNLQVLGAIGRVGRRALITNAAVAINVVLNALLIWHYGYLGAAIATTMTYLLLYGLSIKELGRHGFSTFDPSSLWRLGIPTALAAGVSIGAAILIEEPILRVIAAASVAIAVYLSVGIATRGILTEDIRMLWREASGLVPGLGRKRAT